MLRADLNRAMADGASPAASRDAAEAAAERATREVSGLVEAAGESERAVGQGGEVCEQVGAQYEAKLGEIEGAMRELISQNRALKARSSREAAEMQPSLPISPHISPHLPTSREGGAPAVDIARRGGAAARREP